MDCECGSNKELGDKYGKNVADFNFYNYYHIRALPRLDRLLYVFKL